MRDLQCARAALRVRWDSARWAVLSDRNSYEVSVAVLALKRGEDQVAHVVDIALSAGEAIIIDAPVVITPFLDACAFFVQFLLQLVEQRLVGECLSRDGSGEPRDEGEPDADGGGQTMMRYGQKLVTLDQAAA